jgi:CRP/FNR family transcriptional regulator, anaerobic regulatory protein
MLDAFIQRLRTIHPVSEGLENAFRNLDIIEVPKGTVLLREGQTEDFGWIVIKGLLRSYYLKDGEEICSRFNSENQIVLSVVSFYSRTPGYEFVETLEDCVLARAHYDTLQQIYRDFPEFNFHARVITEYYFTLSERRLYLLRRQSAEERYRYFMEHYPEWLQRIPLKYVATFLGMNLETLSRIRKKISIR